MSKGPNTKDEGTARRRRRKASLRVPSDTVPRRPVEEPAVDESRLAVSVAYALDDSDAPESADGKSIHDLPTLINQPVLPERSGRPDTEETPVPEIVTERLPPIEEADGGEDDDDQTVALGGSDGDDEAGEIGDDEVTRATHEAVPAADGADAEAADRASGIGAGRADSAADASSEEEAAPDEEVIPEIESAQVEAIDDEDDESEADAESASVAEPAPQPAPEPAPDADQPEAEQAPAAAVRVARPGSGGDSVDIAFDEDEEGARDAVPEEVVELAPARATLEAGSSPAAAKSAPAEQGEPVASEAESAAPAAEPSRPRFVRARTMALSDADLEEMMEEARGNEAARAASAPDALDAGESGEILADDMLEEISDGEDAAPEVAATAQVVEAAAEAPPDKAPPDVAPPDKPAPDKPPPLTPKVTRPSPPPAPARAAAVAAVGQPQPRARQRQGKPWFEEVFDEDYLRTLPFLTPRATQNEANFVMESFGIEPGAQVLDVACGYGRHAMELAARGYHVVGLDNSLPLLLRGADEAQRRGLTINFVHGDMREMTFDSQFDGAYCLFSSFGFFDDETNKKVAQNVARALKPGARFVVEVLNRDYLVADLPSRVWWEGDGCVVLEEVEFNYFSSRIVSNRSVVFDDGRQLEQEISLRAFSLHELGKLLHAAGFRVVEISGSMATRGRFLGAHSRDIVVVAERRGGKKDAAE